MIKSSKKSVTLAEILIGAIILTITFAGLLASFVSVRKYVNHASRRLTAANLARSVFNDLYRYVRESDWDSGSGKFSYSISHNSSDPELSDVLLDNNNNRYARSYTVVDPQGAHDYREVQVSVTYPVN